LPHGVDASYWVVGDGVSHYADALAEAGCAVDATLLPSAHGVLQLASYAFANGDVLDTIGALPVYLQGTRPWRKLAE
jgi:tRNA A37 threonylcarbamoyladenosine modification protein TsaB